MRTKVNNHQIHTEENRMLSLSSGMFFKDILNIYGYETGSGSCRW